MFVFSTQNTVGILTVPPRHKVVDNIAHFEVSKSIPIELSVETCVVQNLLLKTAGIFHLNKIKAWLHLKYE